MPLDRVTQYGTDTTGRGASNMQALTVPQYYQQAHLSAGDERDQASNTDSQHPATGGNPLTLVFILLGLIVAMFFVHKSSPFLREQTFGVNWLSFFEVGVMATFFILLLKAVFGRYHVRGITNAVATI